MADNDIYHYSYEPVSDGPSSQAHVEMGVLIVASMSTLFVLALSLTHIVICVGVPKVRADPSKWLQLLVVISILLSLLFNMVHGTWSEHTGLHLIWTTPGLCQIVTPIIMALKMLVITGFVLVSLERLVTLWKEETTGSTFSQRATAILLAVTVGVVLVLSYGIINGFGGVGMSTYHGINYCVFSLGAVAFFTIANQIEALVILILTAFLIGGLCKVRCCGEGNYPLDKVVPVIVGNVLYVFSEGVRAAIEDSLSSIYLVTVVVILLIWLFGESDLRRPLQKTCCPCCPSGEDEENEPILPN